MILCSLSNYILTFLNLGESNKGTVSWKEHLEYYIHDPEKIDDNYNMKFTIAFDWRKDNVIVGD